MADLSPPDASAPTTAPLTLHTGGVLERLAALRAADAPTHGGQVMSYVYDPGLAELDTLAAAAIRAVQPLNALDPTTFSSVAIMEREVVGFARTMLRGDDDVVGTVTSGGTESCILAVKTARDAFRAGRGDGAAPVTPRIVAPTTVHAAFHKAADYLGMKLTLVPVDPETCLPDPARIAAELTDDVALVVVSAPSYPHGVIDPVREVAALALAAGLPLHVDACIGGWVLPFWDAAGLAEAVPDGAASVPAFDFSVLGVTSISADLHKYGYSPKGASVLLVRGRDRQRHQLFATTRWPGYPVVNSTIAGSKSAGPLAAAWAITQALDVDGYVALTARCRVATSAVHEAIAAIRGLRVVGNPPGPLIAVAADETLPPQERVDPHVWADKVREHGWILQAQPGYTQPDGTRLPHTTHLTITPVTADVVDRLRTALVSAADEVRGVARPDPRTVLETVLSAVAPGVSPEAALAALGPLDSATAWHLLQTTLLNNRPGNGPDVGALPDQLAPLLALVEALPPTVSERLLIELIARLSEPVSQPAQAPA